MSTTYWARGAARARADEKKIWKFGVTQIFWIEGYRGTPTFLSKRWDFGGKSEKSAKKSKSKKVVFHWENFTKLHGGSEELRHLTGVPCEKPQGGGVFFLASLNSDPERILAKILIILKINNCPWFRTSLGWWALVVGGEKDENANKSKISLIAHWSAQFLGGGWFFFFRRKNTSFSFLVGLFLHLYQFLSLGIFREARL